MNIINFLENDVRNHPKKIAIFSDDEKITYERLGNDVKKIASILSKQNKQDVVSLISGNSISFIISYLGIIKAGKIVHIAPPNISENNLIKQIDSAGSNLIICSEKVAENISKFSKITIPILKFSDFKEILNFEEQNFKEVTLTGVNICQYNDNGDDYADADDDDDDSNDDGAKFSQVESHLAKFS